ncbi:bifunctional lysylphosphatidylglycerol flippase/synthetase MprF [Sphingobium nicotianae]|uniref:Phosphatidylglycerol lysyltransferase n=1 Tax=Sphingobium nicotianae TaxID=2782607 RepID=A0A9X1DFW4_9SPHN|nr:bifunctional lysylphosphatidylglycerol flippase/synthetase MprF [Sphingobium nicotianae]MBT2189139.1 bifunctional lysylphosphatidylglycerol flippase/synthetase MprF [Sphingobium nicotianae]
MVPSGLIRRHRTALSAGIVLVLAALSFVALSHLLHEVRLRDVRAAWHALPGTRLLVAALLTGLSYLTLTFYDVMALRAIGRPLPYRTAALASFTSYTLSHNLGLSLLTGGSARYRVYSAAGLGAGDIARVVVIGSATFWSGVFVLAGALLAWQPEALAYGSLAVPTGLLRIVGIALLLGTGALLLWSGVRGRTLRLARWSAPLPPARSIVAQIGIGMLDLAAASGALFVLVPGVGIDAWPAFFIGYTFAIIAVLITHVPGGVGVFEALMLIALPGTSRPELVAALIAYRLIYYIAPLLLATGLILLQEGRRWHRPIARTLRGVQVVASGMAPLMISTLVFLGGAVLLVSGSLPTVPWRAATLYALLPLPFVEASHMAGSLVGAALLILSAGLYRRLDGAYWLTRILLLAGALFSLLKGLDYEEAVVMMLIAAALQWARPAFYRRTRFLAEAFSPGWLATVAIVLGLSVWIGLFAYKHVDYQNDLWWQFSERGNASRFLRATFAVAILLVTVGFLRLFRPAAPIRQERSSISAPSSAALALAERTDANLAFTGDKRFLVSDSGQSFLMYQIRGHSWIVMGDPVGARGEWADLLWQLREQADAAQGRLLLYQISPEALPFAIELGLQITKYGEEAHVDLASFSLEGSDARPLRYAERRAAREGATFDIIPASGVPGHMAELAAVSTHWLKAKGHKEKGFSVGRFDPDYMARFDCAAVRWHGRVVAFANIWTTHDKSELSIDLMRHDDEIPYGTMDFLFIHLMQWGQAQGYRWFNLGVAPLSGLEARRLSPLWSKLGALLYQHGNALYGFEGLRAYKEKFAPEWEARFVAGPQGVSFARSLIDLQALIGSGAPARS